MVETIRELAPAGSAAGPRFELTIRMRDRSTRISHEAGAGRWRVGDPVQMIGIPAATTP
jgi:hypothetical protein